MLNVIVSEYKHVENHDKRALLYQEIYKTVGIKQ